MIWLAVGIIGVAFVIVIAAAMGSGPRTDVERALEDDAQMEALSRMRPARRPPERSEGGMPIIKGTGDVDAYEEHA